MTKEKLLQLYIKYKDEQKNVKDIKVLRKYNDEDINIILNSKYPFVMQEIIINHEFKILKENEKKEIIDIINNAKDEIIAQNISRIIKSKAILSSGLLITLAKKISNCETESVSYATDVALNLEVLLNKNGLKLIEIVGSSKTKGQAISSSLIAKDTYVLMNEESVELTKLASITDGEEQRRIIHHISTNREVLTSGMALKLAKLGGNIKCENKAQLLITIASDKILEQNKKTTYYLTKMLLAETYEETLKIYNEAQELIINIKIGESKIKKEKSTFWNFYKHNPEKAIELLQAHYEDDEEITVYTRIKK